MLNYAISKVRRMEKRRELTKNLLGESFKELLEKGAFDKITIKMITERAGVIRPTFYNYFQDKYEVLEWVLGSEIFDNAMELAENGLEREAIYIVFKKMERERNYYQKAFGVTGQNGFEEILSKQVKRLVEQILGNHDFSVEKYPGLVSKAAFVEFQTLTVVAGLRHWITDKEHNLSADEAMEFYVFLMSHSLLDIVQ